MVLGGFGEDIAIVRTPIPLLRVKQEGRDSVIDLSSESEGEFPSQPDIRSIVPITIEDDGFRTSCRVDKRPVSSPTLSTHSRPPTYPNTLGTVSIVTCLRNLASMRRSRNEVATLDYDSSSKRSFSSPRLRWRCSVRVTFPWCFSFDTW